MRYILAVPLAFFISAASAQNVVTKTYYARELDQQAQPIVVSSGYLTVLQFYDKVSQVASGRPDLIRVEAFGTKLYVSTSANSGSTDLVVEVGDRVQMFKVNIERGEAPRRYNVIGDPDRPTLANAAAPPAARSTPSPLTVSVDASAPPGNAALLEARASLSAALDRLAQLRASGAPAANDVRLAARFASAPDGGLLVTVTNGGAADVTLRASDLRVTVDGRSLDVAASDLRVRAGQTAEVKLDLGADGSGGRAVNVEWLADDGARTARLVATARP